MAGGSRVGRLYVEISGDANPLRQSLDQAVGSAQKAGLKFTDAGRRMFVAFENAINPTKQLAQHIKLLEAAGKSSADIWKVYGDRMKVAAEAAKKNGQAVDPLISKHVELNKVTLASRLNFESLGRGIQNFAANPLQAAQGGISSLLSTLGPTAIGLGAVGAGVVTAAVGFFKMAEGAAEAAEQIQNLSYTTGLGVEQIQQLKILGEQSGMGDLTSTIEKLNVQLGSKEGGDFTEAIIRMNIAIKEGAGAIYYLEEMRKKYAEIPDPIKRAEQAAADLGRRLVHEVGPLVLNTSRDIKRAMDEIGKSGAVMAEGQVKRLADLDEAIDKQKLHWQSWANKIKIIASEVWLELLRFNPTTPWGGGSPSQEPLTQMATGANTASSAVNKLNGGLQESARRTRAIAEADAIAAGTKRELVALTIKLNDLEKQYSDEKAKQKGLQFDPEKLKSLAVQIGSTRQEITRLSTSLDSAEKSLKKMKEPTMIWRDELLSLDQGLGWANDELLKFSAHIDDLRKKKTEAAFDLPFPEQKDIFKSDDVKKVEDASERARKEMEKSRISVRSLGDEVSTVFTNMAQEIAGNIIEWKGWAETLKNTVKSLAKSLLSALIEGLFKPLTDWMRGFGNSLSSGLAGIFGGAKGSGLIGGLGGASLRGILGGGTAAASTAGGAAAAGTGAGAAAGGTAGGVSGALGGIGSSISSGLSAIGTTMVSLLTNPITMLAGAAVGLGFGIKALVGAISGPSSWERLQRETKKHYGGLQISSKQFAAFGKQFGLTEGEAQGERSRIMGSPAMLSFMYQQAQQQGKMAQFLGALSRAPINSKERIDLLTPFKMGMQSGDWTALNNTWLTAASREGNLARKLSGGMSSLFLQPGTASFPRAANSISPFGGVIQPQAASRNLSVTTGPTAINITIHGAGDDLVSRVRREVIPILKEQMTSGNTGLREAIVRAFNTTAGAY